LGWDGILNGWQVIGDTHHTSQIRGIDGLKNYIAGEIGTTRFDLYKNSVHPKNLMDTKKAILNYFNPKKDDNLTVIVHYTTPKTSSNK
jgi:hypothetical protein